jgi:hypothetical protein
MTEQGNDWRGRTVFIYAALTAAVAFMAWAYARTYHEAEVFRDLVITFSFVGLGMLIKYGDEAFDDGVFSRRATLALAIPGGLWMGALMIYDAGSATIFAGLLLALLFAGKYDNAAFKVGFATAGILAVVAFYLSPSSINFIGIAAVFAAALLDELGNDNSEAMRRGVLSNFLRERPFLKLVVLLLCVFSVLPSFLYLFAFLGFDFGYTLVERFGMLRGLETAPA